MRKAMLAAIVCGLGTAPLHAQNPIPSSVKGDSGPGFFRTFISSLDWYIWLLLVALFVLIGVFFYLRNKREDD